MPINDAVFFNQKLGVVHTEGSGVPLGIAVEGAHRNDFKMVRETLRNIPIARRTPSPDQPQGMCLDKGYDYNEVGELLAEFGFTAHIRVRGEEAKVRKQGAGFKARRWVVERTDSCMNRFRRVLIRWDKKVRSYFACLHLACAYIPTGKLAYWDRLFASFKAVDKWLRPKTKGTV